MNEKCEHDHKYIDNRYVDDNRPDFYSELGICRNCGKDVTRTATVESSNGSIVYDDWKDDL